MIVFMIGNRNGFGLLSDNLKAKARWGFIKP
jgi:hypothetical protein